MRLVQTKAENMKTGANFEGSRSGCVANFEGSRSGCVCNGTVAVANSHNAGPAYCVGYCGNAGSVTRTANMNLAKRS